MNGHRWGAEGPPLEAYSRVTNPKGFVSLHDCSNHSESLHQNRIARCDCSNEAALFCSPKCSDLDLEARSKALCNRTNKKPVLRRVQFSATPAAAEVPG